MKNQTVTVEFETPRNGSVLFRPLGRKLRGRFDVRKMNDAGKLYNKWPEPIPGERLQLDLATGEGFVIEPLHSTEFAPVKKRIEEAGFKISDDQQPVKIDPATFVHWIKPLVAQGKCKVISGELPAKCDGKPQTRFHSVERPDPLDRLTVALETQSELLASLLARLDK